MKEQKLKTQHSGGPRAERWLRDQLPGLSGRHAEQALAAQLVLREGRAVRKGDRLFPEETLDFEKLLSHLSKLGQGNPELAVPVLFEDEEILVVDKPAGMPSHPLNLFDNDTITHWAFAHRPSLLKEFPGVQPTLAVHRLDKGTSGVLVLAKTAAAHEKWRTLFDSKEVTKSYLAWCWGNPQEETFSIRAPIARHPTDERLRIVVDEEMRHLGEGYPAQSDVTVLKRNPKGIFLARVDCATGVTHQVRVHLASKGFPLVGDAHYDPLFAERDGNPSHHLLRAVSLSAEGRTFTCDSQEFESLLA